MKNSMLNAKQNFSMSSLVPFCSLSEVVVSDMFSHYLAVLKSEDLTQNCEENVLIHQL